MLLSGETGQGSLSITIRMRVHLIPCVTEKVGTIMSICYAAVTSVCADVYLYRHIPHPTPIVQSRSLRDCAIGAGNARQYNTMSCVPSHN